MKGRRKISTYRWTRAGSAAWIYSEDKWINLSEILRPGAALTLRRESKCDGKKIKKRKRRGWETLGLNYWFIWWCWVCTKLQKGVSAIASMCVAVRRSRFATGSVRRLLRASSHVLPEVLAGCKEPKTFLFFSPWSSTEAVWPSRRVPCGEQCKLLCWGGRSPWWPPLGQSEASRSARLVCVCVCGCVRILRVSLLQPSQRRRLAFMLPHQSHANVALWDPSVRRSEHRLTFIIMCPWQPVNWITQGRGNCGPIFFFIIISRKKQFHIAFLKSCLQINLVADIKLKLNS